MVGNGDELLGQALGSGRVLKTLLSREADFLLPFKEGKPVNSAAVPLWKMKMSIDEPGKNPAGLVANFVADSGSVGADLGDPAIIADAEHGAGSYLTVSY